MFKFLYQENKKKIFSQIIIIIIAAAAYLPFINKFSYTFDDWYLMWAGKVYGWQSFQAIYSIDRPLRAYVMMPEYVIFGQNAIWYNIFAWCFRVLSALALNWILNRIWPNVTRYSLWITIMYIVYPGFLSQTNGIDYQAQMISLSAAMISIALTIYSISEKVPAKKWAAMVFSILLGWIYLGLVEYEIGFEFFRLLFVYFLPGKSDEKFFNHIIYTIRNWLPYLLIPIGFLTWRLFIFQAERKATDINVQLGTLVSAPVVTAYQWVQQLFTSSRNVLFYAWIIPLRQLKQYIQPVDIILLFIFTVGIIYLVSKIVENISISSPSTKIYEIMTWGFLSAIIAIIPIILVNRSVSFPYYSRYSLVSSIGTSIFLVSLFYMTRNKWVINIGLGILLLAALVSNNTNSRQAARSTQQMNNFWWQVSWRAPQIEKNTTIITSYQSAPLLEDYFIWGPANLIYFPTKLSEEYMQPGIYAAIPGKETTKNVLNHVKQVFHKRRNILTYTRYQNFLLLSQPSIDSCIHFINGNNLELSSSDEPDFIKMANYSVINHVIIDEKTHIPPSVIFGSEPAHDWCYYYQQADLARQAENFQEVARLGNEAVEKGFSAKDQVEWLPFLQAYAVQNDRKSLEMINQKLTDPYIRKQACQSITRIHGIQNSGTELINSLFCS